MEYWIGATLALFIGGSATLLGRSAERGLRSCDIEATAKFFEPIAIVGR